MSARRRSSPHRNFSLPPASAEVMHRSLIPVLFTAMLALALGAAPASGPADPPPPLRPDLKFPDVERYSAEIGEEGVLLQDDYLLLFAPKAREREAKIIFSHLARAYDELYAIVGQHTKYKLVVYHLPRGWGGTGECVIEYDYQNLDLANSEEWRKHKVPHVSGYIEEMAHNFVSSTKAQFGWEMVGWSLGVKVSRKVADNPIFRRQVQETRQKQAETFARYRALKNTFPLDIEPNLCDRIHAHLLWLCEQRYGARFWPNFFEQIRAARPQLDAAVHEKGADNIRNERYRITVDCFDRLQGLNFKRLLESNGVSTTVDVKSLHPTEPGWDRKFVPAAATPATRK